MSFSPEVLLNQVARLRCIEKLKNLPVYSYDTKNKLKASVLVPLCVVDGEVSLLYTLRSTNLSRNSGQVSFPGGKRDENESATETALRETEEEIGISPEDIDVWNKMSKVMGRNGDIIVTPVVGLIKNFSTTKLKANVNEVDEIFTVPMKTLCDINNQGYLEYANIMIPVYLCGKHKVWGITAIITHMFLQCFLPHNIYNVDFQRHAFQMSELMSKL